MIYDSYSSKEKEKEGREKEREIYRQNEGDQEKEGEENEKGGIVYKINFLYTQYLTSLIRKECGGHKSFYE